MNSNVFRASWILLIIAFIIAAASGLIMIISPQFFMAKEIQGYVGQTWSALESSNPKLFAYFMHDVRLLGFMQFTISLIVGLIVVFSYRKREKLAWFVCLAGITIGLGSSLGLNIPIGDLFVNVTVGALLGVSYLGLGLGAKTILFSKQEQG
jgi:hypothetical protein